jgi:hypothetical protein
MNAAIALARPPGTCIFILIAVSSGVFRATDIPTIIARGAPTGANREVKWIKPGSVYAP